MRISSLARLIQNLLSRIIPAHRCPQWRKSGLKLVVKGASLSEAILEIEAV